MRCFALFAVSILAFSPSFQPIYAARASAQASPPALDPEKTAEMRADILMARKEFAAAIDAYQAILKDDPHNAGVLIKLGVAYQQMGGTDAAESYYKRAARANKKNPIPVNNLGTVEYSLRHYGSAVKYYKQALKLGATTAATYSNLGYAYYAQKKFDLAMEAFGQALALDPTIFEGHGGTGGSMVQQRTAPDEGLLNFYLAKSYAKIGDAERTAHFLKLARDYGYKDLLTAQKDKDFAAVIKDPRVQDVLLNRPSFTGAAPAASTAPASGSAPAAPAGPKQQSN